MKIANADKLKKHFENVVDVKLFTVPEICTIIDTFSVDVPEDKPITVYPHAWSKQIVMKFNSFLNDLFKMKPGIDNKSLSEEQTDVPRLPLQVIPE